MPTPQLDILDTYTLLKPLFTTRQPPKVMFAEAEKILVGPESIIGKWSQANLQGSFPGSWEVCQAAMTDGALVSGKQAGGLFNPTRKREFSDWEFEQWLDFNLLASVEKHLQFILGQLADFELPSKFACLVLPSDPTSFDYILGCNGLSCFSGAPGFITLRMLPCTGNMARLGAILTRAIVQNLRWNLQPGQPLTLADYLVMEGLAAHFAAILYPNTPGYPWLFPFERPADWRAILARIASFYGVADYAQVPTNYFGGKEDAANFKPNLLAPMESEELIYAQEIINQALSSTAPQTIAAHLYGDEILARQGHPTVGLPLYAGFEVGYRLVQKYLQTQNLTIREILTLPTVSFFNF